MSVTNTGQSSSIASSSTYPSSNAKPNGKQSTGFESTNAAQKSYTSRTKEVPWTQHTVRQLKLVLPGVAITYYLGTLDDFWKILLGTGGWWAQSVVSTISTRSDSDILVVLFPSYSALLLSPPCRTT